jgi:hypothetical protein
VSWFTINALVVVARANVYDCTKILYSSLSSLNSDLKQVFISKHARLVELTGRLRVTHNVRHQGTSYVATISTTAETPEIDEIEIITISPFFGRESLHMRTISKVSRRHKRTTVDYIPSFNIIHLFQTFSPLHDPMITSHPLKTATNSADPV